MSTARRGGAIAWRGIAFCLLATLAAACTPTFTGRLRTRDPLEEKKLESYRSGTIVLGIGDVDVRGVDGRALTMGQSAWFEVISDRELRFHVRLAHKWAELAKLEGYQIRLKTDRGHQLAPTAVWTRRSLIEQHTTMLGQIKPGVTTQSSPTYTEETIARDLHGADAVIVFRQPGLVAKDVRSYSLLLDSKKRRLRFVWDVVPRAELADEE